MDATDDVQLPDLQVIQRYSLAVRGATAPRADVIAALQADLDWLSGGGRRRPTKASSRAAAEPATRTAAAPASRAAGKPAKKSAARRS